MGCSGCGSCKCGNSEKKTPEEINAYYNGLGDGVYLYAWWKDSVLMVGTTAKTYKQAKEEIEADRVKALAE